MLDFSARQTRARQDRRRRFPRRQDHAAGAGCLRPRRRPRSARSGAAHSKRCDQRPGDLDRAIRPGRAPRRARREPPARPVPMRPSARDALSIFADGAERRALIEAADFRHRAQLLIQAARHGHPGIVGTELACRRRRRYRRAPGRRSVAQPGRALLSGGRGRRFKSSHSDQQPRYFINDVQPGRTAAPCQRN